jgi:branched-chain amino acid transport system permease protein
MTLLRNLAAAVVAGAVIWAASVQLNAFRDFQIAEIAVYVVAIAGLSVLIGLSGQISLGHGAFMAVGAYTTALLMMHLNWPLWAVFPASSAVAAAGGAVVGVAAARLHGPYLAGATLMLAVALPSLVTRFAGVFGGDQGLSVSVTAPAALGAAFPPTRWLAWVCAVAALVSLVLLANLARSRVGRSWRAIRDDPVAAALAGMNVAALRVLAFVVSAACAGLAGAMLAVTTSLVSPGSFTLSLSIALLAGAVLGGLGTLAGALWGSLVIVLVPSYVTDVATSHGLSGGVAANIPIAAYGVVLVVVMLVFPEGIQGGLRRLAAPWLPVPTARLGPLRRPGADREAPGSPDARPPAGDPYLPYRRPPASGAGSPHPGPPASGAASRHPGPRDSGAGSQYPGPPASGTGPPHPGPPASGRGSAHPGPPASGPGSPYPGPPASGTGSPHPGPPASGPAAGPGSPRRRPPVSEHQEEGTT